MEIEILDVDRAISSCQKISNYNDQIVSQIDHLQTILNNVNSKWESNGMDKESYMQELQKQINNLNSMKNMIETTANSIMNYAENIKTTSNKTMNP